MNKLRKWIRRYFAFTQREVNAFLFLIILMVLLTAAPFLFNLFYKPDNGFINSPKDQQKLDSLVALLEAKKLPDYRSRYAVPTVPLRLFNPNQLSVEEWQAFGLPKYLAQRILNYRKKVGDLTYKAELGKIYGLPDSIFQRLYPYIELPIDRPGKYNRNQYATRTRPEPNWETRPKERFILAPFNINTADTTQLKQIKGIGSKLSARIIKYRNSLGGFRSMAQVQEVYGLSPEVVDSLQKYTFIPKSNSIAQIDLNKATAEELRLHPYISSNVARAIVAYREQHGAYQQVAEIKKIKLVSEEVYLKLEPYLTL